MARPPEKLRWEHWACAALLSTMAFIAFTNVLTRRFLSYSLAFTEEITINCFVWLTVVASGLAFERGSQLGMVSLCRRFPVPLRKALAVFSALLGALLFAAVDVLLIRTIYSEITIFQARSPAMDIPVWIYYAVVPALSVSVFRGIYRGARTQWSALGRERVAAPSA